jgi:hypothetical protein
MPVPAAMLIMAAIIKKKRIVLAVLAVMVHLCFPVISHPLTKSVERLPADRCERVHRSSNSLSAEHERKRGLSASGHARGSG